MLRVGLALLALVCGAREPVVWLGTVGASSDVCRRGCKR